MRAGQQPKFEIYRSMFSGLRQLSSLSKPLIRIESAKQFARRMAALPTTYEGAFLLQEP